MTVEMDGNPIPSAKFQWTGDKRKGPTIRGTQIYPHIYKSTYTLANIPASYCGRVLTTKVANNIGTSALKNTVVTVLRKSDKIFVRIKEGEILDMHNEMVLGSLHEFEIFHVMSRSFNRIALHVTYHNPQRAF